MCRDDVQSERVLWPWEEIRDPDSQPTTARWGETLALLTLEEKNHRLDLQPALLWGEVSPRPPTLLRKKDCFDNEVGSPTESQQSLLRNADSVIDQPPILDGNMGKVSPRWRSFWSFWSFTAEQRREIRSHV